MGIGLYPHKEDTMVDNVGNNSKNIYNVVSKETK